jgi:hypothetical protein
MDPGFFLGLFAIRCLGFYFQIEWYRRQRAKRIKVCRDINKAKIPRNSTGILSCIGYVYIGDVK